MIFDYFKQLFNQTQVNISIEYCRKKMLWYSFSLITFQYRIKTCSFGSIFFELYFFQCFPPVFEV